MRSLGPNLSTMTTPGCFLGISQAKLESQNLMFRLPKNSSRQKKVRRIRRKPIAKSWRKSNNKMKNINANLKTRKTPKLKKLKNFGLTPKIVTISKTLRTLRHLKNSRGQPKETATKFKVWPNKLLKMKPKGNLTKPCKTRSTKSTKMQIIH